MAFPSVAPDHSRKPKESPSSGHLLNRTYERGYGDRATNVQSKQANKPPNLNCLGETGSYAILNYDSGHASERMNRRGPSGWLAPSPKKVSQHVA